MSMETSPNGAVIKAPGAGVSVPDNSRGACRDCYSSHDPQIYPGDRLVIQPVSETGK